MACIVLLIGSHGVYAGPDTAYARAGGRDGVAAAVQPDAEEIAVVALREGCGGAPVLTWGGSGTTIIGAVHANGGIELAGSGTTASGPVTSPCPADVSGSSVDVGGDVVEANLMQPPVSFDPDTLACDYEPPEGELERDGPWWEGGERTSRRLRDGVYCADGDLTVSGSSVTGTVTLIARGEGARVRLDGSSMVLEPYASGVLAWSEGTGDDAIEVDGSGGTWSGDLLAPNGGVTIDQSGGEFAGALIVGQTVHLAGSGWTITGRPVAPAVAESPDETGAIAVHVYACPFAAGEERKDSDWFDSCLPGPAGVVFQLTPASGGAAQIGTTGAQGEVTFADLSAGTYTLRGVDVLWCKAISDSVNPRGEIDLQAGEEAHVWIFVCA